MPPERASTISGRFMWFSIWLRSAWLSAKTNPCSKINVTRSGGAAEAMRPARLCRSSVDSSVQAEAVYSMERMLSRVSCTRTYTSNPTAVSAIITVIPMAIQ